MGALFMGHRPGNRAQRSTLSECTEEAAKDITVQTSLLEARQLAGPRGLFQEFSGEMQANLKACLFHCQAA